MNELDGKVAFITGGSSGIGLGIARAYAGAGMKVAIGYRTQANADHAMAQLSAAGSRVHAIRVEVTDPQSMENAAAEVAKVFGKVHVLVNNAGVQNPRTWSSMNSDEWDRLMSVNVGGVFNGVRAFLPLIKQHGEGGHVITTASILGLCTMGGAYGAYCASKFAVVAMMETLRAELCMSNIGVSMLCPGPVKSNLEEYLKTFELAADPAEIGRLALRGMQSNDLYILTHPEFNPFIQSRSEAILRSTPQDVRSNPELARRAESTLQRSVYLAAHGAHLRDRATDE
jgi:NAD(P)-dependent dehydrogenase (short-subunit alcohol dehydrogenase family)